MALRPKGEIIRTRYPEQLMVVDPPPASPRRSADERLPRDVDITVIEQAKVIARLQEYSLFLDSEVHHLEQERDNVILERDVAQAEAAEYKDQLDAIREAREALV